MNNDTVNLLKKCNAGIKMGVNSIDDVLPYVKDGNMKGALNACKDEHATLGDKTHKLLVQNGGETKDPHPVARAMSEMKTRSRIMFDRTDASIADIMTDGCNMGIKSLHKYINKYENASAESKEMANRLIEIEERLVTTLTDYL